MRARTIIVLTLLLTQAPTLWAGGIINPKLEKVVVIDEAQAASLTNQTDRLMHSIRIPEVDFRQANIADIVKFYSYSAKKYGKTKESRAISISLGPKADKELMTFEKWEGSGGMKGIYTFSGLDMSLLEAVVILQAYAELDRKIDGNKVTLELKDKVQQQPAP